jgi:integrase
LEALPGRPAAKPWVEILRDAVPPEFRVQVYRPVAGDTVLYGPTCAVQSCPGRGVNRSLGLKAKGVNHSIGAFHRGYLCLAHVNMWRRDGERPIDAWVRYSARALKSQQVAQACTVRGCRRSGIGQGLCSAHHCRWDRSGRPDLVHLARTQSPAAALTGRCSVPGCRFPPIATLGFCDAHAQGYRSVRYSRPELTPNGYLAHFTEARKASAPSYDLRGLPEVVQLELQLALQCRQRARKGQMQPLTFGQVVRWLADEQAGSALEHGEAWWVNSAKLRWPTRTLRANPLAWLRYVRQCSMALREEQSGEEIWRWDTWPTDRIDVDGRWAHQPVRRIYFAEIEPGWLRELAKRWARWRLTSATKSPASIAVSTSSIRRFCRWAETNHVSLGSPAMITRTVLERYRADVFLLAVSPNRKSGLLTDLKVFLDDVRRHEWADRLPANATYHRGEIPRARKSLPRFIDEYVMGQLETQENLDRLPDLTTRTAVVILIETGLRSIDCLRLRYDPITTDEAGAPYLVFFNHKLLREAIIPISKRLLAQIRRQQQDLAERFAKPPSILLPRVRANPDGEIPFSWGTLGRRLDRWLADCEVCDVPGKRVRVTTHQFRHTVATRMVNNKVPIDTIQQMLDHSSPAMTAVYATIKHQTLREEFDATKSGSTSAARRSTSTHTGRWRTPCGPRRTSRARSRRFPTGTAACRCSRPARTRTRA